MGERSEAYVLCTPKTTSLLLSGKPTKEQKETIKAMVREWTSFAKNMKVKKKLFFVFDLFECETTSTDAKNN